MWLCANRWLSGLIAMCYMRARSACLAVRSVSREASPRWGDGYGYYVTLTVMDHRL